MKVKTQNDMRVSGWPIDKFSHALEAAPLIKTGCLKVVTHDPHEQTVSRTRFGYDCLQQHLSQPSTAVSFRDPQLLDFGHARPTVPGYCPDLNALLIQCGETELAPIILPHNAAVIFIEPVL